MCQNENKPKQKMWTAIIAAAVVVVGVCCILLFMLSKGCAKKAPSVNLDPTSGQSDTTEVESVDENLVQLTPEFIEAIQKYDQLSLFSEGYAAVCKNGKWGYIDKAGQEVIPCKYDWANTFHEGLASVRFSYDSGYGFIDTTGREVIRHRREIAVPGDFSEGLVVVKNEGNDHFFVLDKEGRKVFQGSYGKGSYAPYSSFGMMPYAAPIYIEKFIDGKLYIPKGESGYNVYDTKGNKVKEVSDSEMEQITKRATAGQAQTFTHTLYTDKMYGGMGEIVLWGVKDANGKIIVPAEYDKASIYFEPEKIDLTNGVIPVVLIEYSGISYMGEWLGICPDDGSVEHYGYVDLKGHDTFPKGLKERCKQSRLRAIERYKVQEAKEVAVAEDAMKAAEDAARWVDED
ncbi:WG repeat-containing protein [Porphyromonas uenonis]|uniref:WG repeat-containing protein n=1 Tax=Porphyromonas uenonis TaxID=281920 RepID=UPI0026731DAD|nr:WG repeat-containing protein [Porphyromonas uenonis]